MMLGARGRRRPPSEEATMRFLFSVLSLLASVAAQADESRLAPAVGEKLTYRLVTTTMSSAGKTTTVGQVYSYTVISSDGAVAEASIKLDAMLFDCKGREEDPLCAHVLRTPGAREDGGLILVPVPDDLSTTLAKDADLKVRYFIVEKRVISLPTISSAGDTLLSADDPLVVTNVMDCDEEPLKTLPPNGDAQHATFSCRTTVTAIGWTNSGRKPASTTSAVTLDVVDFGVSSIKLPSGTWDARRLKMSIVSNSGAQNVDGETRFSEKLGVAVKTHWRTAAPNGETMTEADSELIAATP
jgi:hypothetical protein